MQKRALEILTGVLDGAEASAIDAADPRFIEITDLAALKDFAAVASRVESLVQAGVYDIRLIVLYLFYVFEQEGVDALGPMFACLEQLLGPNLAALGPAARKDKHIAKSVGWLCQTITDRIEYYASKKDEQWRAWQRLEPDTLNACLEALGRIGQHFHAGTASPTGHVVGHLARWLRELQAAARPRETAPPGTEGRHPRTMPPDAHALFAGPSVDSIQPNALSGRPAPLLPSAGAGWRPGLGHAEAIELLADPGQPVTLRGSAALRELLMKLEAFEMLVEAGKYDRAALLCDDVHALVDHFDPRLYFPELFATFGRLVSENIGKLEVHWQQRDSSMWNALRQFSRVDLAGFVKVE